jgi:hypothetical protein
LKTRRSVRLFRLPAYGDLLLELPTVVTRGILAFFRSGHAARGITLLPGYGFAYRRRGRLDLRGLVLALLRFVDIVKDL